MSEITPELVHRFALYLRDVGPEWGNLHVVMADGNWDDQWLHAVIDRAPVVWDDGEPTDETDYEAMDLARILLGLDAAGRRELRDRAEAAEQALLPEDPKPCLPIPCPPFEEVEINVIVGPCEYVPGQFTHEAAAFYSGDENFHREHDCLAKRWNGTPQFDGEHSNHLFTYGPKGIYTGHCAGHGGDLVRFVESPAEFTHTEVRASYPAGTDPLAAIRDAMGVFMERRDGTNAMEWWQRVRWWHGGPAGFKRGDLLLPPTTTGVVPALDGTDHAAVYITTDRRQAILFALRHNRPVVYEVTIDREPLDDDVMPNEATSKRVHQAKVWRIEQPSRAELRAALELMTAPDN